MDRYFTRQRFGRPQLFAGLLLLAFGAQAAWLVRVDLHLRSQDPGYGPEQVRIHEGLRQWHGNGIAGAPYSAPDPLGAAQISRRVSEDDAYDTRHSPLLFLLTSAPLLPWREATGSTPPPWYQWLPHLPFLAVGLFLGASLWYVARRLCGNTGGFVALTLYCFSPEMIQAAAAWNSRTEVVPAWGAFGTVFTAIAVAHTLYAPREVVLWNWRRIVLLGVSLAIAVGSQFSMIVVVPIALAFLLYVAPVRLQAGLVIWLSACAAGLLLLLSFYFFHPHAFLQGLRHADFSDAAWRTFVVPQTYHRVAIQLVRACPALILALPVALAAYFAWPRARYFGNTAPLLVAVLFFVLGIAHPQAREDGFLVASWPFWFIFISGVLADLMETSYRAAMTAVVLALLLSQAIWNIVALTRVGS